ncbi:MAG: hypothetical protein OXU23_02535 [Candidatus Poribacteria bacterium]|nr:hypothetical protein [Candidatus Poribacteria bacterium]
MYRDIRTNKWVLGGVGFLIVLSIACVVWYQHDIAPEKKAAADAAEFARQWEINQKTQQKSSAAETTSTEAPADSTTPTAEKPITETPQDNETTNRETHTDRNVTPKNVRMSPHGFGPYPKIPDGWPQGFFDRKLTREHELLGRVRIKLHEQGIPTLGVAIDKTGRAYPFDKDQVYITFDETYLPDLGHVRYIADIFGDATVSQQIESNAEARTRKLGLPIPLQIPIEADIPAGVQVLDKSEGFDPYEFLNLKRQ